MDYKNLASPKHPDGNLDTRKNEREDTEALGISHRDMTSRLHSLSTTSNYEQKPKAVLGGKAYPHRRHAKASSVMAIRREPSRHLLTDDLIALSTDYNIIDNNINNMFD